jgi:hypothetical protein
MQSPKNLREFRALASQPDGIGIKVTVFISPSLMDDAAFNVETYMEQQMTRVARDWNCYDSPDCIYTVLPRTLYEVRKARHQGTVVEIKRIVQIRIVKDFVGEGSANRGVDTRPNSD